MDRPNDVIPDTPGSYQFKDASGRVIYVGKAKNLRARVNSYFGKSESLHPRTLNMVTAAASVEWIQVRNEIEALILEHSLIERFAPRFNIRLRDDKSYPFLAVTTGEKWPRALVMRGQRKKGVKYFGPYPYAWTIHETLDLLLKSFPVRTCSSPVFDQHQRLGRPCLLFHIEKCAGPCVGKVTPDEYSKMVNDFINVMDGQADEICDDLEKKMGEASKVQDFERAAKLRDQSMAINLVLKRQQMVGDRNENMDVIGVAENDLEAAAQVFFVRKGRIVGQKGFVIDKVEALTSGDLTARIIERLYDQAPILGVPKVVLVPDPPDEVELLEHWLTGLRGSGVEIRVPLRGDKRELHQLVTQNAKQVLDRHMLKRSSDHTARTLALTELQQLLNMSRVPLRIECYDMAHLQGTSYVGSMVVMEDGLPNRKEYRQFKLKTVHGNDDYAAMREVLTRRLNAYIKERDLPFDETNSRPSKFSYAPQLILVDGGKGQLGVAHEVVNTLGLGEEIFVAALAKKLEQVFIPGRQMPVDMPRDGQALYMLQVIRDEAHRFANKLHRQLRDKAMKTSELDGIPGLGKARMTRLVNHLGSVRVVKQASREELANLTWLPNSVADLIFDKFHAQSQIELND